MSDDELREAARAYAVSQVGTRPEETVVYLAFIVRNGAVVKQFGRMARATDEELAKLYGGTRP